MKRIDDAFRNPTMCVKFCQVVKECTGVMFGGNGVCMHYLGTVNLDLRSNAGTIDGKMDNYMYTKCKPITCQIVSDHFGASKSSWLSSYNYGCAPSRWQTWFRGRRCTTTPKTSTRAGCRKTAACVDKKSICSYLASKGECEKDISFVKENCEKSCGLCSSAALEDELAYAEDVELVEDIEVGQGRELSSSLTWNLAMFFVVSASFTLGYYYQSSKGSQQSANYVEMA